MILNNFRLFDYDGNEIKFKPGDLFLFQNKIMSFTIDIDSKKAWSPNFIIGTTNTNEILKWTAEEFYNLTNYAKNMPVKQNH